MSKSYTTSEVAKIIKIHPNIVRLYEELKLISKPRRQENGYRVYTDTDIQKLIIIKSLRCANYSLSSILRMLQILSANPQIDIRDAIDTSQSGEDIKIACDNLLTSLKHAEENAKEIYNHLIEMKNKYFSNPPF